jgi:hypothetical protein
MVVELLVNSYANGEVVRVDGGARLQPSSGSAGARPAPVLRSRSGHEPRPAWALATDQ